MNLLLDTHVVLWWFDNPALLSETARRAVAEGERVYISAAVAWEIAIKKALGKLAAPDNLQEVMATEHFLPLSISLPHALAVASLPPVHQDPFDRVQIAQAKAENLVMVSRDARIKQYNIPFIEA